MFECQGGAKRIGSSKIARPKFLLCLDELVHRPFGYPLWPKRLLRPTMIVARTHKAPTLFSPTRADIGARIAALAQLVEHRIRNAGVTGSSPVSGTRTPKIVEKQSSSQRSSHDCRTGVSHTPPSTCDLTSSKTSVNRSPNCSTSVSHRRHVGLWRRGAIYQYRVRAPADLRPLIRASHINR